MLSRFFFDGNDSCFLKVTPGEEFDFFGFGKEVDVADKAFFLTDGLADDFANGVVVGLKALVSKNFIKLGGG